MSIERRLTGDGSLRYKARVKWHGRVVASRTFRRRSDALAWEQEQLRRLRLGEWIDPRRGRASLESIADEWLRSRVTLKRTARETEELVWRVHVKPRFGRAPIASITRAEVASWLGGLLTSGRSPSTARRYLATLRSILAYAVADDRVNINVAAVVKAPTNSQARREGMHLSTEQLHRLATVCGPPYGELVLVLGLAGLRWGELAGLQIGDLVFVPDRGLRLSQTVLSSNSTGELFIDTLKTKRGRTVPLVAELVPIVDRWAAGKELSEWLFTAPEGGPLPERSWKRLVSWSTAVKKAGVPGFRVHDLRHTAASLWLGAGADPKVVQRILGHASAAMTMDLYGHLIDNNLWAAAERVGTLTGPSEADSTDEAEKDDREDPG
jgi:integrase